MGKSISEMKIALAGAGGSGKTTLMNAWSKKYNVDTVQVETKSFMPQGVSTHLDIINMAVNTPEKGIKFQRDLITHRNKKFIESTTGFISDRSVIDSYAYYAMHNSMFDSNSSSDELLELTVEATLACDITIVLLPNLTKFGRVPSNGIRVDNTAYYDTISAVILNTAKFVADLETCIKSVTNINVDGIDTQIIHGTNTSIVILYESGTETGIASTESRMKAIEIACNYINLV